MSSNRIGLDLSKFKHVKSDDKSTTLQHKDGHTMTIQHNVLSKVAQQQLSALKNIPVDAATPSQQDEMKEKSRATNPQSREDKGYGAIQMKAEGGPVEEKTKPTPDTNECITIRPDTGWGAIIRCGAEGGEVAAKKPKYCMHCGGLAHKGQYAEGGDVESNDTDLPTELPDKKEPSFKDWSPVVETPESLAKVPDEDPLSLRDIASKSTEGALPVPDASDVASQSTDLKTWSPPGSFVPKESSPNVAGAEQEAATQQPQPSASSQPASEQAPGATLPGAGAPNPQDAESMLMSGYNQRLQGVQEQAQATGALGEEQAKQIDQTVQAQQDAKQAFQQHYNDLEQERQAFMHDVQNGQIDPNKYWTGDANGNGGHSRIAAGIGMILAGFNPTNKPNAAIEYVKSQMEMNVKAQERNLSSKENLVNANLRQFGNLKDAADMTRIMQHDMLSNELASAAAKAQTPMSKALALDAAGKIKMDTAPLVQQFAMRRAMMSLANNGTNPQALDQMVGYLRATNPEAAKEIESRYVPGVGLGKVPVPEGVRQELVAKADLQKTGQDLLNYTKTHTNLNPMSAEHTVGVQKAAILQQKIREGMLGTVFRESEKPLLKQFVDTNPANAFKMITTEPKLKTLLQSNEMSTNTLKRAYGLPESKPQDDNTPIKGKDGRMYKKSADGKFMIPVGK